MRIGPDAPGLALSGGWWLAASVTGAGVALSAWTLRLRDLAGIDDADIFLTYARNLVNGHGFVYTPGFERVEGVTSLLWVAVSAAAEFLPGPAELFLLLLSVLLCAASILLAQMATSAILRLKGWPHGTIRRLAAIQTTSFVLLPGFLVWNTVALMDVPIWTFGLCAYGLIVVTEAAGSDRKDVPAILLILVLTLSRPEAMLVVPGLIVVGLLTSPRSDRWRSAMVRMAVAVAANAGLLAFRLAYFGFPFPNTYYAKVSPDLVYRITDGLMYLGKYLVGVPAMIPVWVLALAVTLAYLFSSPGKRAALYKDPASRAVAGVAMTTVLVLVTVALAGGDHFGSSRFVQPVVPLLLVLAFVSLAPAIDAAVAVFAALPFRRSMLLAGAMLAVFVIWSDFGRRGRMAIEFRIAETGRELGRTLGESLQPGPLPDVGVVTTGGFGLTYPGRTVDLLGLNWVPMAHEPGKRKGLRNHAAFDPSVFWREPPTVALPVLLASDPVTAVCPASSSMYVGDLTASAAFREHYVPGMVRSAAGRGVSAFFAREWVVEQRGPVEVIPWDQCPS